MFKLFKVSEFSARIPSAFFGTLLIPVVYFAVKRFTSKNAAIVAAILVAFGPLGYWWSRICRMYSMFELFFFASSMLLFFILSVDLDDKKKKIINWLLLALLISITVSLQLIGIAIFFIAAIYIILAYLLKLKIVDNKIVNYSFIVSGLVTAVLIIFFIRQNFKLTTYYITVLNEINPLLIVFVLGGIAYGIWKKNSLSIFSAVFMITPIAIYSVFSKDYSYARYILNAMPFAFIIMAIPIGDSIDYVFNKRSELIKNISVVIAVVAIALYAKAAINYSYSMPNLITFPQYKEAAKALKELPDYSKDDLIITTIPVASTYYIGKTDYWLRTNNYKHLVFKKNGEEEDIYTGSIRIKSLGELKKIIDENKKLWIFADERLTGKRKNESKPLYINEDIKNFVQEQNVVYEDKASRITIYRVGKGETNSL